MNEPLAKKHDVKLGRFALLFGFLMLLGAFLLSLHLAVNVTPSMPIGIYHLLPVDRPIVRGDVVQVCPSPELAKEISEREKSKLRGACAYHTPPLLKFVAAVQGDVIELRDSGVSVNGVTLPGSAAMDPRKGGKDWVPVPHVPRGRYVLGVGQLWLWTPYYRSWDSRYFGPIALENVRGFASPLFTGGSWADWEGGLRRLASIPPAGVSKKN